MSLRLAFSPETTTSDDEKEATMAVSAGEATSASGQAITPAQVGERPLLVFFAAPRSGRAKRVEGFLAQVLQRRHNHETFRIVPVDAVARPDLVDRFRIESLPALAVVEGRKIRCRLEAPRGCEEIETLLQPWLR